jgi:hypothetical protein
MFGIGTMTPSFLEYLMQYIVHTLHKYNLLVHENISKSTPGKKHIAEFIWVLLSFSAVGDTGRQFPLPSKMASFADPKSHQDPIGATQKPLNADRKWTSKQKNIMKNIFTISAEGIQVPKTCLLDMERTKKKQSANKYAKMNAVKDGIWHINIYIQKKKKMRNQKNLHLQQFVYSCFKLFGSQEG